MSAAKFSSPQQSRSRRDYGKWEDSVQDAEMGITPARSLSANMRARLELFAAGSATTENLPMKLEHGGNIERASMSSSDRCYSITWTGYCAVNVEVVLGGCKSRELSTGFP